MYQGDGQGSCCAEGMSCTDENEEQGEADNEPLSSSARVTVVACEDYGRLKKLP